EEEFVKIPGAVFGRIFGQAREVRGGGTAGTGRAIHPFTSVTRWLLVVAGCIGLELMQPAFAADDSEPAADAAAVESTPANPATTEGGLSGDTVLYPSGQDGLLGRANDRGGWSGGWAVAGVLLVAVGAWAWLQRRRSLIGGDGRKLIAVEETKSLGNRQFLVVASCDGRRLLLGVSPG